MANSRSKFYLICYDIADKKRLQKVHRLVKKTALAIQYSVYLAELTATEHKCLVQDLKALILETEDRVKIYTLPQKPHWESYGRPLWQEGVLLAGSPLDFAA